MMKPQRHHYDTNLNNNSVTVLIFPTWSGLSAFEIEVAETISSWGFRAIAVDLYGIDNNPKSIEEKQQRMIELVKKETFYSSVNQIIDSLISELKLTDKKLYTVGYCLGGKLSLAAGLYRSDIAKSASIHGLLDLPIPKRSRTQSRFLLLNGNQDPMVTTEDKHKLLSTLDTAKSDWQLIEFGEAMHSFTLPSACNPLQGVMYHQRTASRAMSYLRSFFAED